MKSFFFGKHNLFLYEIFVHPIKVVWKQFNIPTYTHNTASSINKSLFQILCFLLLLLLMKFIHWFFSSTKQFYFPNSFTVSTAFGNSQSLWESPYSHPYFDNSTRRDMTITVGQTANLHCKVRNLGDRAVSGFWCTINTS